MHTQQITPGRRAVVGGMAAAGALGVIGMTTASGARAATSPALAGGAARSAVPAGGAAAVKAAPVNPTLKRGSTGPDVLRLQQKLTAAGFWLGTPDGTFGHLTQQAVWAAQKFYGLTRDGVVGPQAWAKILTGARPTPRKGSGYRIEVDVSRQLLLVVWGNSVKWTLNTSTGSGSRFYAWGRWYRAVTPPGSFKVYSRYNSGWQTGALGSMWRPYYFNGGIAIYGSADIPPYPASHGCCRLSTAAQDMLIANIYLYPGRQVVVY